MKCGSHTHRANNESKSRTCTTYINIELYSEGPMRTHFLNNNSKILKITIIESNPIYRRKNSGFLISFDQINIFYIRGIAYYATIYLLLRIICFL